MWRVSTILIFLNNEPGFWFIMKHLPLAFNAVKSTDVAEETAQNTPYDFRANSSDRRLSPWWQTLEWMEFTLNSVCVFTSSFSLFHFKGQIDFLLSCEKYLFSTVN